MRTSRLAYLVCALCVVSLAVGSGVPPSSVVLAPRPKPVGEVEPLPVPEMFPSRVTPLRLRVLQGEGLLDDAQALSDRDTGTRSVLRGDASLVLDLEATERIESVRIYGNPAVKLSVFYADGAAWAPVPGLDGVDVGGLGAGWNALGAAAPFSASAVRVDLSPLDAGAALPEIEIWRAGEVPLPAGSAARAGLAVDEALPASLRAFDAGVGETVVEDAPISVSVDVPRDTAQFRRAWLVYELRGLASWMAIPRAINGRPSLGGVVDAPAEGWAPQVERIDPAWLEKGDNTLTFEPTPGRFPYAIRGLRLLVELDTAANAVERVTAGPDLARDRALHPAVDGEPATPWVPVTMESLILDLDRTIEPQGLGVLLGTVPSGTLEVRAVHADGTVSVLGAWGPGRLGAGWNLLPLQPGTAAERLDLVFAPGSGTGWQVQEVFPLGSGVGQRVPPSLTLAWPTQGEFSGREAYIRGFVSPADTPAGPPRITVGTRVVEASSGAFGVLVSKDEVGFGNDEDRAPWSVTVQVDYPGGPTIVRTVPLTRYSPGPESTETRLLGPRTFSVRADQAARLRHDGAALDLEAGAVESDRDLKITPLRGEELPALDAGMTNVTRGPRRGYRFEPHGTRFTRDVHVTVPYDAALIPKSLTEADVRTFYFDDQSGRWQPLSRVGVEGGQVVSLTNHFTDMVNATLAPPDAPGTSALEPTQFSQVSPADPGERIVLIDPPKANSSGDARVSYALDLPPGRADMAQELALEYSSASGNGWMGMGWSLSLPSVSVDTRWGAPRFDGALETETYMLGGEPLTPGAHRGALEPRTGEKTFRLRREGRFARIVRHGADPASYWWEVTDKDGKVSIFGGAPDTALADDGGRVSRWLLRERRDPSGNGIRYAYARVDDFGLPAGTVLGRQLYLKTIEYTAAPGSAGPFTVRFLRDADLGESARPDVLIDGRGGFKEVTSQLLRRIEVLFGGAVVRSWSLEYAVGAFEKTLLAAVTQRGADGSALATHRFAYHDDVREGGAYDGFADPETWQTGADDVRSTAVDEVASLFGSDAGRASALSGYETTHAGAHLYVGFNPNSPLKTGSAGGKVGFTGTIESEGLLAVVDLNGDHLPDKLFRNGGGTFLRLNRSGPGGTTSFGPSIPLPTLPAISEDSASTFSAGPEAYFGFSVLANFATGITSARTYIADVNGDGLPDLVQGGNVLFNHLDADGVPTFDPDSATSPFPVGLGTVEDGVLPDYGPEVQQILQGAPLVDTLRRWIAPYAGQVRITGDVLLVSPPVGSAADGVRVAIQHDGTELWAATIEPDAKVTPTGVDAVSVAVGDHLYFRVQSRAEGSHDAVTWDPEIVYVGAPATPDGNNLNPNRFKASEDFTLAGRPGILTKLPFTGRVRLVGDLHKTGVTTDEIVLVVYRNDAQVYADVLSWDEVGDIETGIAFDVQEGDTLRLRVRVDSPIDLGKIVWAPSLYYEGPPDAPAPTHEVDGQVVTLPRVADDDGNPIIQLHPAYHIDMYPVNDLKAPQQPWVAGGDGTIAIRSHLTSVPGATGIVYMTAKRNGELAAKRTIFITDGVVQNRVVDIEVEEDDRIFLDYSCLDPDLAPLIGNRVITVNGDEAPSAFHTTPPQPQQGVFPLPYRGWGVAGYNGAPPRDGQPIVESDLEAQFDQDSDLDPRTDKAYLFTPFPEGAIWLGPEHETVVSPTGAQSSRLGPNAVSIPGVGGPAGRAPVRLSSSQQDAVQVGVAFLSGSASDGDGGSDLDFQDMNGDQFPDVVGRARIQYSPAVGGLEAASRAVPGFPAPRATDGTAGNVGVGGSPANFRIGSRGQVDSPGRGGAQKENDTRAQMVALGLSGSLGSGSSSLPFDLIDLNGDGLPDRVVESGGAIQVGFNLGYGFAPLEPFGTGLLNDGESSSQSIGANLGFNGGIYDYGGGLSLSRNTSETKAMLADVNGDGLPDRLRHDGAGLHVGLNAGNRFLPDALWSSTPTGPMASSTDASMGGGAYFTVGIGPVCILGCWVILNPGADGSTSLARQETTLLDLDGDGFVDHVASVSDDALTVIRNTTGRTNLLRSIERPLGARIEIDYAREGNTSDLAQSRWVLSRVSITDGLLGDGVDTQLATFRYGEGRWDRLEREFRGFGAVMEEVRDPSQGEALVRVITRTFAVDSFYTHGLRLRERLEDGAGRPFMETEQTYEVRDESTGQPLADLRSTTATGFPALVRTDRRFFEGQPAPGKTTYATQEYDALGNIVRTFDAGDAGTEDDLEATLEYANCPATHIVGVPVGITVRGDGTELQRRHGDLDCTTGKLTRISEYLANGTAAETRLEYDGLGNLVRLQRPPNRNGQRFELQYQYDGQVQTHVTRVVDSFGYVSTSDWDPVQGLRTRTQDLAGNVTTYTYDAHGRLTTVRGPYEQAPGTGPTVAFEYHPEGVVPWSRTRHLDTYRNPADPIDAVRFVDGLRRVVQEKTDATLFAGAAASPTDAVVVSGRVLFDALGRVVAKFHPTTEPGGTPGVFQATPDPLTPTRTTFDVQDRPLTITEPDGAVTLTSYGFGQNRDGVQQLQERSVDAKGAVSFRYRDVREQVTGIKDQNRVGAGVQEIWTSYAYDALKRLTQVKDDRGNVTRIEWDNLGRKTAVDSPDEGRTEEAYDLAGNRTARITANLRARGAQIGYAYAYTRLERIVYPDLPGNGVSYTYGAPGSGNGAGRVVRITDGSGNRERTYGKLGEIVSETRSIASATGPTPEVYTTASTYDSFNRLQRMSYPDGEALTFGYDAGGKLRQIKGQKGATAYDYLRRMEYDRFGEKVFLELGNGARTTYAYRPDNRFLERVRTTRPDGRPFVDLTYAYDPVGNVLSRTNNVPVPTGSDFGGPSEQVYTYDDLDRMTSSRGSHGFAPNKTDRYAVAFDYDTIHNMTLRNQAHEIVEPSGAVVRQGKTSYTFQYAYGGSQPHAATHVGDRSFLFDANGNQLGWQDDRNGTRRDVVWDEENRMHSLSENGQQIRFVYDDHGDRVIKRGPQGETVYVNAWFTMRNRSAGTKHVWAGSMRIASKLLKTDQPVEKDRYFYHSDHTGTTNFVTDAAGALYEHLEYFPFGETWVQESSNTQRTPYVFTAKELDEETGLSYLGARYHDPRLGGFNSGEPLLFAKPEKGRDDPRFLSVYSYAYQNPERMLDPDGRDVIILVGEGGKRQLREGYSAAAVKLQSELKDKGITARIVNMNNTKGSAVDALRAEAAKAGADGQKVGGLTYIGHGDVSSGGIMPKGSTPVSVREAIEAAGVQEKGSFTAWGCEVTVGKDFHTLKGRGINVYTTRGKWTYTKSNGQGAIGHPDRAQQRDEKTKKPLKEEETPYGNIGDFTLSNVTQGINTKKGELNILGGIVDAHQEATNSTK